MTEEEFKTGKRADGSSIGIKVVSKDTNPKDAVGVRKAGMSCIPAEVMLELGLAMQEGARKYGRHNYRVAGVRASVYYDAAMRHLMAWWEGEDIDPDSGLSHLVKAMACLLVIRDGIVNTSWVDDRPPALPVGWQIALNKKAGDLIDRLPESKDAYTNITTREATSPSSLPQYQPSRSVLTTNQLPLPLNDSLSQPLSSPGYIDPKQHGWNPLLEREAPGGNGDILQEA